VRKRQPSLQRLLMGSRATDDAPAAANKNNWRDLVQDN
jgi:hypothetical protein